MCMCNLMNCNAEPKKYSFYTLETMQLDVLFEKLETPITKSLYAEHKLNI